MKLYTKPMAYDPRAEDAHAGLFVGVPCAVAGLALVFVFIAGLMGLIR